MSAREQLNCPPIIIPVNVKKFEIIMLRFFSGSSHVLLNYWGVPSPSAQTDFRRNPPNKNTHRIPETLNQYLKFIDAASY